MIIERTDNRTLTQQSLRIRTWAANGVVDSQLDLSFAEQLLDQLDFTVAVARNLHLAPSKLETPFDTDQ